jgi:hypothetical protein
MGVECYVARKSVKGLAEALGWSLALGRGGLSGLSNDEIQPETRSQELVELSTMSYWSTMGRGFQTIHGRVASGSEGHAASLAAKGLDPFGLAMLAIPN